MQDNICFALLAFHASLTTRNWMLRLRSYVRTVNVFLLFELEISSARIKFCVAHLPRRYIQCYTKDGVAPPLPGPRLIELN